LRLFCDIEDIVLKKIGSRFYVDKIILYSLSKIGLGRILYVEVFDILKSIIRMYKKMRLNKNYFNYILVLEINFIVVVCLKCNILVDRKSFLILLKILVILRFVFYYLLLFLIIVNIIGRNFFGVVFN